MKTNQIMIPNELRKQRTKDGYLNATHLIAAWNDNNPDEVKQMAQYKILKSTKDFIEQLKKEGIEKPMIIGRGKGASSGTWMHPKLFVDFAMWISIEFKSIALGWIVDGLIKSRNDAGDYYNEMTAAIVDAYIEFHGTKPPPLLYIIEANRIKELAGVSKDRNKMTEDELRQITYLQKVNANLISKGIGKTARLKRLQEAAEIKV